MRQYPPPPAIMQYEQEHAPPPRKWPLLVMILLCVLLLAGCATAFWLVNEKKYEETKTLAQNWEFEEAKRVSRVLMPMYEDLPSLKAFIDAGLLMESGGYEEAQQALTELGDYLNAEDLKKECQFRYGQILYSREEYAEACDVLRSLGDYSDAALWADESSYCVGIQYYTELGEAQDDDEIYDLAQKAVAEFSSVSDHENAEIMLDRTAAYIYSLAMDTFDTASAAFNQTQAEPAASDQSALGDSAAAMFQDAKKYFSLIPFYMESENYIELIGMLELPDETAATRLCSEMWDFAPARKFILGKYIPYFFYGYWSGGGYGITFTDVYHFYMLKPEDGATFGSGGISNNSSTGWKTAYQFNVLSKDSIEVLGTQTYTLSRAQDTGETEGDDESGSVEPQST